MRFTNLAATCVLVTLVQGAPIVPSKDAKPESDMALYDRLFKKVYDSLSSVLEPETKPTKLTKGDSKRHHRSSKSHNRPVVTKSDSDEEEKEVDDCSEGEEFKFGNARYWKDHHSSYRGKQIHPLTSLLNKKQHHRFEPSRGPAGPSRPSKRREMQRRPHFPSRYDEDDEENGPDSDFGSSSDSDFDSDCDSDSDSDSDSDCDEECGEDWDEDFDEDCGECGENEDPDEDDDEDCDEDDDEDNNEDNEDNEGCVECEDEGFDEGSDSDCDEDEGPEDFDFNHWRKAGRERKHHWNKISRERKEMSHPRSDDPVVVHQQETVDAESEGVLEEREFEGCALI